MDTITAFIFAFVFAATLWHALGFTHKYSARRIYKAPWRMMFAPVWSAYKAPETKGWRIIFGSFTYWPGRPYVVWIPDADEVTAMQVAAEWNNHQIRPEHTPRGPLYVIGEGGNRRVVDMWEKWQHDQMKDVADA